LEGLLDNHHHATAPTTASVSEIVEADTDEQLVLHQVQEDQGVPSPDGSVCNPTASDGFIYTLINLVKNRHASSSIHIPSLPIIT
jgi:hypothetical protein